MPVSVSDDAADAGNEPGLRPLAADEWGDEEYAAYGSMLRMPGDRVPRFGSGHAYDPERFSVVGTFVRHPALAKAFWGFNGYQLQRSSLPLRWRELAILRSLSELPDQVLLANADRAPHKIATWVRELADRFHGFYHDCYVMGTDVPAELTQARLWLVEASRVGLAIGLDLLGVSAPESM